MNPPAVKAMAPKRAAGMAMMMQPKPPMIDRALATNTVRADKALCQYTCVGHWYIVDSAMVKCCQYTCP